MTDNYDHARKLAEILKRESGEANWKTAEMAIESDFLRPCMEEEKDESRQDRE